MATAKQFKQAFKRAGSDEDFTNVNIALFMEYGKKTYKPVYCSIKQLAALIRYQCMYLDGEWDMEELQSLKKCSVNKFIILD